MISIPSSKIDWYWINMDRQTDRRDHMLKQFSKFSDFNFIRVRAYNRDNVTSMIREKKLVPNGFQFTRRPVGMPVWKFHRDLHYSYAEGGCLLSHLKALEQISLSNAEYAIVSEDDAHLDPRMYSNLMRIIDTAPKNWDVLQLHTNNEDQSEHCRHLDIDWIHWFPHHWGTLCYVVRVTAAQRIISSVHVNAMKQTILPYRNILVADEFIYFKVNTYTYTKRFIGRESHFKSTIQPENTVHLRRSRAINLLNQPEYPKISTSLLILTQFYVLKGFQNFHAYLNKVDLEYDELRKMFQKIPVWIVVVVLKNKNDYETILQMTQRMRTYIDFVFRFEKQTFAKWKHLMPILHNSDTYDHVLVVDCDQSLVGFPWRTYMQKVGSAVISSPIREALDESLMRDLFHHKKRQWFQVNDARWWRLNRRTDFLNVQVIRRPFLEMFFVLFEGAFASWFFKKISSIEDYSSQSSSWGVDYAWCGAAAQWSTNRIPCVSVPITSKHLDSRTINRQEIEDPLSPVKHLQKDAEIARWIKYSKPWRDQMGGYVVIK
jgi:GR25 family glycosyltransferase involved in LPS biosynthesis